jgi:hypothetical protein
MRSSIMLRAGVAGAAIARLARTMGMTVENFMVIVKVDLIGLVVCQFCVC